MDNALHLSESSPQEKILQAARNVFFEKGMEGARMQEIADMAGINKALLHYYFRNKESLFNAVFGQAMLELLPALTEVFRSDRPLLEKISDFFTLHIGFIQENPMIPHFIITASIRNPLMILKGFQAIGQEGLFQKFSQDVNESIRQGEISPVDPVQLILNLISLSVFPFLAQPLLMKVFEMDDKEYSILLEKRKTEVAEFVINALK
jgi:AcrR family transcriptional regulator